ncbi:MAG TPA: glutamine--fructose-6-phosphate transaminase (isomerizing), partial [Candidatus Aenigmarchaeota archaeon]|nr:glutamine--fructose-6-phosphate transaminase (isomerizing) [Candidatus Aenigmarchaeota archaeon]
MCGIIGYVGDRRASPLLFSGLKKLEYRGYDSAGMATLGSGIHLKRVVGEVKELEPFLPSLPGTMGIAHTRWATHGGVSERNAHPHLDCSGKIAVVHNGIIENYEELKEMLKGHEFKSETDTEVIAHLVEENLSLGPLKAVFKAMGLMRGAFSFIVMIEGFPCLIAGKKDTPLYVGVGEGENFVASDVLAFPKGTKVIPLEDYEVAVVSKEGVAIYKDGKRVERKAMDVSFFEDFEEVEGHYMYKEIKEEPKSVLRAMNQDLSEAVRILKENEVCLVASGTSYHACLMARLLFSKVAGKKVEVYLASEFPHFLGSIPKDAVIFAVSQSGETADVLEAVKVAKRRVISLVNVPTSTLARISDHVIHLNAGPEVGVAATKSYVNQLVIFTLLAYGLAGKLKEGRELLRDLPRGIRFIFSQEEKIKRLAEKLKDEEHVFLIGRGYNHPSSLEGALKIKEISYIHAEGFAGGELKHGTLALIEEGTPCIAFVDDEEILN